MTVSERLAVTCPTGLEGPLSDELTRLGLTGQRQASGVVWASGPSGSHVRVNVRARLAERVLLHVASVQRPEALSGVALAPFRSSGAPVALEVQGPAAGRYRPAAQRWLGALAKEAPCTVVVDTEAERAEVWVDTSGAPLHVRGYRQETGKAPLRETLAAGLLAAAGWRPGLPLWDVTCGAGTFVIEAAEQNLGLWPGRQRGFAFEAFPGFRVDALTEARRPGPATPGWIRGTDLNAGALGVARRNARRAGALDRLTLERVDATKLPAPPPGTPPGLVLANLPYGLRVGERDELGALYRGVGQAVRRALPGWRFAFLVQAGEERLGLPIATTLEVRNGGLRCRWVQGVAPGAGST